MGILFHAPKIKMENCARGIKKLQLCRNLNKMDFTNFNPILFSKIAAENLFVKKITQPLKWRQLFLWLNINRYVDTISQDRNG